MRSALPDISIRQLEYLVAVADAPTWADAAAEVGVSPSALSQGLAELERRLGVSLFERDGRRRRLRPTVRPALDHARQVTALTADLVRWSERLAGGETGRVGLGMIDVAAVVYFPEALRRFRSDRAEVELSLTVASSRWLIELVAAGELDLAVCVEPPASVAGVATIELFDEPLVVYAPASVRPGRPSSWGPWLLFPEDSHTRQAIDRALRGVGAPTVVAAESHQPDVLREMVGLEFGWTVLPPSQGGSDEGGVQPVRELLLRTLVLARRSDTVSDPAVDDLADRLVRVAGQTAAV